MELIETQRIKFTIRSKKKKIKESDSLMSNIDINEKSYDDTDNGGFFISGGGTKGVYAIGVIKYLFDENKYIDMNKIKIFGGTSVGSFIAIALSLGAKKDDIDKISNDLNLNGLIDSGYLFLLTAIRYIGKGFLYCDSGRRNILKTIMNNNINIIKAHLEIKNEEKFEAENITFGHLKKLIDKYPNIYKHFIVNSVDISRCTQIFMTTLDDKWDDITLFDAIMASSSIPYVFKPVNLYFDKTTNFYSYKKTENSMLCTLIDGGTSTNDPLDYFLIENKKFKKYKLSLLKFNDLPEYINTNSTKVLAKRLIDYILGGKNDIRRPLIERDYHINTIDLHITAGTLDMYSKDEIKGIVHTVYNECKKGIIKFE